MKVSILVIITLLTTISVHASVQGQVRNINISNQGAITFSMYYFGQPIELPACATSSGFAILNENSRAGRHQLALLIAANSVNQDGPAMIFTTGQCTRVAGYADVESVQLQ